MIILIYYEIIFKSKIKGKEKSTTEFYYEIKLESNFNESDDLKFTLNPKKLFDKTDIKNNQLFKQYLPSLTTLEKITNY